MVEGVRVPWYLDAGEFTLAMWLELNHQNAILNDLCRSDFPEWPAGSVPCTWGWLFGSGENAGSIFYLSATLYPTPGARRQLRQSGCGAHRGATRPLNPDCPALLRAV
jgi:hypothetical protein